MDNKIASDCKKIILGRLAAAGPNGLTTGGLKLPGAGSKKGKVCRDVLKVMLREGDIGNLGSPKRPCYVTAAHFKPLEIAYKHVDNQAREAGVRLGSKNSLSKGLNGTVLNKVDEALRLLVAEGALLRLKWAGRPVYVHAAVLPQGRPASIGKTAEPAYNEAGYPQVTNILRAYRETVNEFGYPDVLIHEVFLRLGGELKPLKQALMEACRSGLAVPSVGDWSLSSPEERNAALYINGHPHLRVRFKE